LISCTGAEQVAPAQEEEEEEEEEANEATDATALCKRLNRGNKGIDLVAVLAEMEGLARTCGHDHPETALEALELTADH
jgi:hypothetical protein